MFYTIINYLSSKNTISRNTISRNSILPIYIENKDVKKEDINNKIKYDDIENNLNNNNNKFHFYDTIIKTF